MNKLIKAGEKELTLHNFTGKVMNATKNMETKVHGGGGGGMTYRGTGGTAPVKISSTTVVHDQVFLQDDSGKEKAMQLEDFNLACREGNNLTMLWAIKTGDSTGPYIAAYNHSTDQVFFSESHLRRLFLFSRAEMMKWAAIIGGAIGLLGSVKGVLIGAAIGAALGFLIQITNRAAIKKFKSQLTFSGNGDFNLGTTTF